MTTQLLRGKRLRLTRLDECFNWLSTGTSCAFTVTSGFITVTMTPEYEAGDEFIQKNANGDLCLNRNEEAELKRITVGVDLCGVDFSVVELATGDALELDWESNPVGVRSATGKTAQNFALELWTGVEGPDACAGGTPEYGYFLLPALTGAKIGEVTVENGPINVSLENGYTVGGGGWGVGPWDVIDSDGTPTPSPLLVPMGAGEHRLMRTTVIAPPAVTDGCQVMP